VTLPDSASPATVDPADSERANAATVDPADSERASPATVDPADRVRQIAVMVGALARNGLTYGEIDYDLDRYRKLAELAAELLAVVSGRSAADLTLELGRDSGYATPKVDVRGVLFDDRRRVLLMQERSDGLWSLPGGWADPFDSPSEAVIREVSEESGYQVTVTKLAACWDRDRQGHVPPLPVHAYKLFFLCAGTGVVNEPDALETLAVGWFGLDELPPLSLGRVTARQLERMLVHHLEPQLATDFD
jgi:ADP-ribose pyrophosphatase YjhB (NUDIX family)